MREKFRALNFHFLWDLILTLIMCMLKSMQKCLNEYSEYVMCTE